ncbi:flagellin N-terminal helical domain-containing protein [Alkaliphilus peptidifermentans]|uniref:Flagellin n=1 Tax=Alkaliphilus peptidifermentans DSM 18978 TaxID=1120976 RepID=A0A1G5JEQ5_9FIRM|nr:flagellin [Alkaliphilus peptidifermentans]SCY86825.1 flagellin [Alkaliphilus peptidifermentans DSM 18978]
MRINNNIMAMNTHRQLGISNNGGAKSMEKLSSGFRINRAADDAAGLSISEKMRSQIRGLQQASRNAQDGISLIQTAEGNLNEVSAMLVRVRELATQAAHGTYDTANDLPRIQEEVAELTKQINDIKDNTKFNGIKLLNGSGGNGTNITLQIGAENTQTLDLAVANFNLTTVAAAISGYSLSGQATAATALGNIETQINAVSKMHSYLGANQNRLEHTIKNLDTYAENLQASESRIRDVDMAKEMMEFTKQNILQQASTAMLAQANQAPQGVLQLLR